MEISIEKEVKLVFDLFDQNKDGYITEPDIHYTLKHYCSIIPTLFELKNMILLSDQDKDGKVSQEEFFFFYCSTMNKKYQKTEVVVEEPQHPVLEKPVENVPINMPQPEEPKLLYKSPPTPPQPPKNLKPPPEPPKIPPPKIKETLNLNKTVPPSPTEGGRVGIDLDAIKFGKTLLKTKVYEPQPKILTGVDSIFDEIRKGAFNLKSPTPIVKEEKKEVENDITKHSFFRKALKNEEGHHEELKDVPVVEDDW